MIALDASISTTNNQKTAGVYKLIQPATDGLLHQKKKKKIKKINEERSEPARPRAENQQSPYRQLDDDDDDDAGSHSLLLLQGPPQISQSVAAKQELVRMSPAVAVGVDLALAVAVAARWLSPGAAAGDGGPAVG